MQDADNVVLLVLPHGKTRVPRFQDLLDDFLGRIRCIDGHHFGAVDHGVQNFQILKIENAAQHVAVVGDETSFLVVKSMVPRSSSWADRTSFTLETLAPKRREDIFHKIFNGDHNRAKHRHEDRAQWGRPPSATLSG